MSFPECFYRLEKDSHSFDRTIKLSDDRLVGRSSGLRKTLRFDMNTPSLFFFLQDPSIGGLSGGPVWDLLQPQIIDNRQIVRGGIPVCCGIVHGTLSDGTGGKLAAITPSFYLVELIRSLEAPAIKTQ